MAGRFIKLYDKILSWEWFSHPNTLCLFIYLLLKAYYKDTTIGGRVIKRGQLVTSLPKISTDTGLSIQQIRTAMSHLISTGEITDQSNTHNRIITIVKYDDYQTSTDRSTDRQQTTNRQNNRQSTDKPTAYIESIEDIESNRKIEKKNKSLTRFMVPTLDDITSYIREIGSSVDPEYFFDYYQSNGWTLKGGQKMKDWKATLRNWERRETGGRNGKRSGDNKEPPRQDYSFLRSTIIDL